MAKTFTVTVGPRAYSFHDQSTGITISRGEAKELTSSIQFKENPIGFGFWPSYFGSR